VICTDYTRFVHFLKMDLEISENAIAFAEHMYKRIYPFEKNQSSNLLSIILWQHGLMTIEQLNRTFVWLEKA
jgi:Protein of unknown function (DUF2949)